MASLFDGAKMLGSVSPLQALRGMLDMSLRWWRESLLVGAVRALLLAAAIFGLLNVVTNPVKGLVIAGIGLLGFYILRRE